MCEMSLTIVRYGLQCSEKSGISKSDEKHRKMKVVQMGLPGVENVPTPRESIFTLSRGSQLPYMKKKHKICFYKEVLVFGLLNHH